MKQKIGIFIAIVLILSPVIGVSAKEQNPSHNQIEAYTVEIGSEYNICPELLQAIIERESNYDPCAVNGNCIGLMQISKKWHTERMEKLGVSDLTDPYTNILVGTDYLAELFDEAVNSGKGDDLYYVLMRYNLETSTANKRWSEGDYSDYAIEVAERAAELETEHGK